MESVEKVAAAVLYEGYLLYPYTRSTLKNQQRWTFGGVYPREYSEATGGHDPWRMQTQCLLLGDAGTEIEVKVRFLHVLDLQVIDLSGEPRLVDELRVGERVFRPWEEATERELLVGPLSAGALEQGGAFPILVETGREDEPLADAAGGTAGALRREWQAVHGEVGIGAERVDDACYRLTVTITNATPLPAVAGSEPSRAEALRHAMISTHTILRATGGEFVSLLETPEAYARAAQACENVGTWPVLAGEPGDRHTLLSSPIILYDYPEVSPESPGDLFDATEIDELLTLSVLTLTDEEKREMREGDPRGREILERTEALTQEQLMAMHGTIRSMQTLRREER